MQGRTDSAAKWIAASIVLSALLIAGAIHLDLTATRRGKPAPSPSQAKEQREEAKEPAPDPVLSIPATAPQKVTAVAFWEPTVRLVPDPLSGGNHRGLLGRVYFSPDKYETAVRVKGRLTVQLSDETSGSTVLERWEFGCEALTRSEFKDKRRGASVTGSSSPGPVTAPTSSASG